MKKTMTKTNQKLAGKMLEEKIQKVVYNSEVKFIKSYIFSTETHFELTISDNSGKTEMLLIIACDEHNYSIWNIYNFEGFINMDLLNRINNLLRKDFSEKRI